MMEAFELRRLYESPAPARRWPMLALECLLVSLLLCQGAPNLYGQANINASLSGSILDATGGSVPGADVTLTEPTLAITRTQTTSLDGRYAFTLLPVGTYTLRVEKEGFRAYDQKGIILGLGQAVTQDVGLELGVKTQTIEVTGAAPMLNTTNANVESTVTAREAVELPLNWRTPFALAFLDSSVNNLTQTQAINDGVSASPVAEQVIAFFSFGGGRHGTTAYLLDGHWNATGDWNSLIYAPSVDEVQEFKMQTYAFTAQYGLSSGNTINVITKGGSNEFHGGVFEFLRNSAMDANNFMSNRFGVGKPTYRRNQFGAFAGGPVYIPKIYEQRDKTFVFGIYEGNRQPTAISPVVTIPTASMRSGDFSALLGSASGTDALGRPIYAGAIYDPFSTRAITAGVVDSDATYGTGLTPTSSGYIRNAFGATAANGWVPTNMISSAMLDPVSQNMLQYYPNPTNGNLTNNFATALTIPAKTDRFSARGDHNISDKSRLFGRYSKEWITAGVTGYIFGQDDPGGPGNLSTNDRYDIGFGYSHVFGPTTVMSYNFGVNKWVETYLANGDGFTPSALGLPSILDRGEFSIFPDVAIDDTFGLGSGNSNATPRQTVTNSLDLTHVHGAHTLQGGFMNILTYTYAKFQNPLYTSFGRGMTNGPNPLAASTGTGYGFATFLLGAGSGNFTTTAEAAYIKKYFGWYFQDDWKVTRKLSLSLGLRYDIQTPTTDRFDRLGWFDPQGVNPISSDVGFTVNGYHQYVGGGQRRGLYETEYANIAPRLSLTYKIADKLVMRSGYGIFYTPALENGDYQGLNMYGFAQTTPWVGTVDGITPTNLLSDPMPSGLIQPVGKADGQLTQVGQSLNAILPTRPTPYAQQWMWGLQYAPTSNDVFDMTYVGNKGTHLTWGTLAINQLTPADLTTLGPTGGLTQMVNNPFYGHIASSGCGLDGQTIPQGQLLRRFPQFCGVSDIQDPSANSSYNAVMFNYNHRWSQGLHILVSFTISKYIDQSAGTVAWANPNSVNIQNAYNLAAEKSLDAGDIPKSLVINYVYELPLGRGKKFGSNMNKLANGVVGGWQLSGITTLKDGFPLGFTSAPNSTSPWGGSMRPDVVADPAISDPTIDQWFNTAALDEPAPFVYGSAPRTQPNLRAPGLDNWDLTLMKNWPWGEKRRIQFRTELYNAFNTPYFHAPNTRFGSSTFGQINVAHYARSIQLGLKIYW